MSSLSAILRFSRGQQTSNKINPPSSRICKSISIDSIILFSSRNFFTIRLLLPSHNIVAAISAPKINSCSFAGGSFHAFMILPPSSLGITSFLYPWEKAILLFTIYFSVFSFN